jgi:cysteine synthase
MSARLGLSSSITDQGVYENTVTRFKEAGIRLPTFAELADPATIPADIQEALEGIEPDAAHPLNLFRVHWYNSADRKTLAAVPEHMVLPSALTGVDAPIIVVFGQNFPMINAHKVLAAYGCLAPRVIAGQYDPTHHRAVWPSTGNYCRGGLAISKIMRCRGVAVLPEGMSQERFHWLESWATDPKNDIIRTYGTESNVKEIYDECARLAEDEQNVIFNQFCEFGNHLVHYSVTGQALQHVFETVAEDSEDMQLAGYISATGSAGTLAAGDWLKDHFGADIAAVEALECPTLLYNGFGEHNIQGIGDKHVPYIHNVMNTDYVIGISDESSDSLGMLFNTDVGREYLIERRGLNPELVERLSGMGFSGIANVLAAIKLAKYRKLGSHQALITVATDGWAMYETEKTKIMEQRFNGRFDAVTAGEAFGQHLLGTGTDDLMELNHRDRDRMFNLGYFTWVEQQGVSFEEFQARRDPTFWTGLRSYLGLWDEMIDTFNAKTGQKAH